jgi:hypothetical protein
MADKLITKRNHEYTAPWGRALWVISLLGCVVVIGVPSLVLTLLEMPLPAQIILAATPVLIIAGAALFMINGFEMDGDVLRVKRPAWTTPISLSGLRSVEFDPEAMKRSIRVVGNGGLFAFNGLFWSKKFGKFRVYVTDLEKGVVLKFADRVVVVSPDEPERFIDEARRKLAV